MRLSGKEKVHMYEEENRTNTGNGQGVSGLNTYGSGNAAGSYYGNTSGPGAAGTSAGTGSGSYGNGLGYRQPGPSYNTYHQNYTYNQGSYGSQAGSANTAGNMGAKTAVTAGAKTNKKDKKAAGQNKGPGFFKKAVSACALGLVFGLAAAGGFMGLRQAGIEQGWFEPSYSASSATSKEDRPEKPSKNPSKEKEESTETASSSTTGSAANNGLIAGTTNTVVSDVSAMVADVIPSAVKITNNMTVNYYYFAEKGQSSGSGIIIGENDNELVIVTNYHVIENNDDLLVTFIDDSSAEALVKGMNEEMDLAVIAVKKSDLSEETLDEITIAKIGDSDQLKIGEPAIAIGNALGYGLSVTTGVISALDRELSMDNSATGTAVNGKFIQTDAAINPGNSGGALLNINGEVIGINSNKIGGNTVEGMGYAIPISYAKPIIENLMSRTTKKEVPEEDRGYLGISGATVTAAEVQYYGLPKGVYVAAVNGSSPADVSGIEKGDFITEIEGESVDSMEELQKELSYYSAGTTVQLKIKRQQDDGSYRELLFKVTLGDKGVTEG